MLPPELSFELPDDRIARVPADRRDRSRLLCAKRESLELEHLYFSDLPSRLRPGDCLVVNDTRVLPARLRGHANGREMEILLLEPTSESHELEWTCLARPARKIGAGLGVAFPGNVQGHLSRTDSPDGICRVAFSGVESRDFPEWLETTGELPLPPYFKRHPTPEDRDRYQTVFADERGSVAAPTAGLHFTKDLLETLKGRGVLVASVTLHVGYGTFAPLKPETLASGQLHAERYRVPAITLQAIDEARRKGGRIVAVGTTTTRALESAALGSRSGLTRLLIQPGFRFQVVDALITNFHLPDSSLLLLVAAFMGTATTRHAYEMALRANYRFYSYGDAMLIE